MKNVFLGEDGGSPSGELSKSVWDNGHEGKMPSNGDNEKNAQQKGTNGSPNGDWDLAEFLNLRKKEPTGREQGGSGTERRTPTGLGQRATCNESTMSGATNVGEYSADDWADWFLLLY